MRLCECMCVAYYFSLASSSHWQPNYHFQRYTDIQIENCTQECGPFLTGCWFMRCLWRKRFSLIFFLALFFTLSSIVSYLRRQCHQEEERKWIEEGKFVTNMKKCLPPLGFKWIFQKSCCICTIHCCIAKALPPTGILRYCSPFMITEICIKGHILWKIQLISN